MTDVLEVAEEIADAPSGGWLLGDPANESWLWLGLLDADVISTHIKLISIITNQLITLILTTITWNQQLAKKKKIIIIETDAQE